MNEQMSTHCVIVLNIRGADSYNREQPNVTLAINQQCKLVKRFFNRDRMCGKGIGLRLFPSNSLESQSYNFDILHT